MPGNEPLSGSETKYPRTARKRLGFRENKSPATATPWNTVGEQLIGKTNSPLPGGSIGLPGTADGPGQRFISDLKSAGGGDRTHTPLRIPDFESSASANSATPAETSAEIRRSFDALQAPRRPQNFLNQHGRPQAGGISEPLSHRMARAIAIPRSDRVSVRALMHGFFEGDSHHLGGGGGELPDFRDLKLRQCDLLHSRVPQRGNIRGLWESHFCAEAPGCLRWPLGLVLSLRFDPSPRVYAFAPRIPGQDRPLRLDSRQRDGPGGMGPLLDRRRRALIRRQPQSLSQTARALFRRWLLRGSPRHFSQPIQTDEQSASQSQERLQIHGVEPHCAPSRGRSVPAIEPRISVSAWMFFIRT